MSRIYVNGSVSVGTTPTLIVTPGQDGEDMVIQNNGSGAVFLGGSTVSTTGANIGISLAAGATLLVPTVGGSNDSLGSGGLYGIVASGTATVAFLYASSA